MHKISYQGKYSLTLEIKKLNIGIHLLTKITQGKIEYSK